MKQYKIKDGRRAVIYTEDHPGDMCIVGRVEGEPYVRTWGKNGREYKMDRSAYDLIEVGPWDDFKVDDKVLVWDGNSAKFRLHFAGLTKSGKPMAFDAGKTSFTNTGTPVYWENCEKWED